MKDNTKTDKSKQIRARELYTELVDLQPDIKDLHIELGEIIYKVICRADKQLEPLRLPEIEIMKIVFNKIIQILTELDDDSKWLVIDIEKEVLKSTGKKF